jgi:hypothetical protein
MTTRGKAGTEDTHPHSLVHAELLLEVESVPSGHTERKEADKNDRHGK